MKMVSSSPTPTFVDPSHISVLGKVEGEKANVKPETMPAGKKKKRSDSPKPFSRSSKKKPSTISRPSSEDLKNLDDKWAERFARLEAMLLSKSFAVPVETVVKPAEVISQKPFFYPGASTSKLAGSAEPSGPSLVQATGDAVPPRGDEMQQNATQPVRGQPPSLFRLPVQVLMYCLPVPVMLPSVWTRPVCHQIQQQTPTVTGPRPPGLGSGCTQPILGKSAPPPAILGKVVEKLQDYPCNRIILIAPGWPNMPWFWDLVAMSSQIPLCLPNLPNLLSQPFNQTLHRNLSNLNLHAWLLEPQQSRSRDSLRQWQHELRLLKEDQPDPSMRKVDHFYKVVPQ